MYVKQDEEACVLPACDLTVEVVEQGLLVNQPILYDQQIQVSLGQCCHIIQA